MAHVRQQVRDAVAELLRPGDSWRYVFKTRIPPTRDVLPFLLVYIDTETSEPMLIHPLNMLDRTINVSVRGHAAINRNNEDDEHIVDTMAEEIESVLTQTALNTELGGKLKQLYLASSFTEYIEGENERDYVTVGLDWVVRINTVEGDAGTLI